MDGADQDAEIVSLLNTQDERAIGLLFERFFEYLCSVVYRVIHDYEASRDLVQDLFFDLWKKRESIHIETALRPYLKRAAINRGLNYIKKNKKYANHTDEASVDIPSDEISGQLSLEHEELEQRIFAAIEGLPPKCRQVFSLSRFESMSYQEIADSMGISIKTVENQISKALKILRVKVHTYAH